MQVRARYSWLLAALLIPLTPIAVAADAPAGKDCTGFRFNLDQELKLFAGKPQELAASADVAAAPAIRASELYDVALASQPGVRLAAEPGKAMVADGSYAGILKLTSGTATLRVTINEPAWVDVISEGQVLDSTRHTGGEGCKLLRKSVEFSVKPQSTLLIQISGSTAQHLRLAVTNPL